MTEKRIKYLGIDLSIKNYIILQIICIAILLGVGIAFRDSKPMLSTIAFIGIPCEILESFFGFKKRSYTR